MRIWFVREGRGGTPFIHEGPRRNTKNCNGNTFVHGGRGGPRRTATATATSFCPRRAAKGREELQRQHICPRRTRRAAENCNGDCNFLLSTEGRGGTRRTATATHLSTEDTEGRGELQRRLQLPFVHGGPRRNTKNCNGNTFVHGGHGGPRRTATATATSFCPRRAAKNCNGNTFVHGGHGGPRRTATATATSFCPRRAAEGHEENHCKVINWFIHEGPRRTPYVVDADHGRRSRESGEKRSDCARRRPIFVTL